MQVFDRDSTRGSAHYYRLFCCDDKWIVLVQVFDPNRYWPGLCVAFGREDMAKAPQFDTMEKRGQNRKGLISILDRVFATTTKYEWVSILEKNEGFIFEGVRSLTEVAKATRVLGNVHSRLRVPCHG